MKKANFDYTSTNSRASRIYRAMISAFPECRSRQQFYICLKAAAKMTDAEAAEIVARYSSASGVWGMLPESEQIAAVERIARTLPKMEQRRAMRRTVDAIRADIENGGDGNSVRGSFPAYVRWMLDKRGNVTRAAVELVTADAFAFLPAALARADEKGTDYIRAIMNAVKNAAYQEYSFRNPGRLSRSGGVGASLDEMNETGERAKLGTCGDRVVNRTTEENALVRLEVREILKSPLTLDRVLTLRAAGYSYAEIERETGMTAAAARKAVQRARERWAKENA